ncbi:flavin reductase family protein [Streptomyces tubercidicus]|uniref:flavin reductase family protein n=1 Tax=Streptomyces tubercidicus TaxID=47759 RepID=UPI002E13DC2F|nr:flavin reductase family protein [Streptomyces tubercidicus]WSX23740.1 flavin reductase family protein [Streptomyces tubercidicus]
MSPQFATSHADEGLSTTVPARPSEGEIRAFRACAGSFATGVCIVSSEAGGVPAGMTLNSFASVSLDPFLVLVSLMADSRTSHAVHESGRYSVSVLAAGQRRVALAFARRGQAFPLDQVERTDFGFEVPSAVAHIHCQVHDSTRISDHDLVIGKVVDFSMRAGPPLVFHAGRFGRLHREDSAMPDPGLLERFGW